MAARLIQCHAEPGMTRQSRTSGRLFVALLMVAIAAFAGVASLARAQTATDGGAWHEFQGLLTAVGHREVLGFGGDRRVAVSDFEGSLVLSGVERPSLGFRVNAVVFNDSATGMMGRAVWTDDRGDQVYSELRGAGDATGNRIVGSFVGGTGRYAGATGTYEFSWRFVLETEDGTVQGQSQGLKGKVRASPQPNTQPNTQPDTQPNAPGTGGRRP